jgi:hypothetical protein
MQIVSLDLHGYTVSDALTRFVGRYNRLLADTLPGGDAHVLEVIHGRGKGDTPSAIRDALRAFLREHGKRVTGFDTQLILRGAVYLLDKYPGDLAYIFGEDATRNPGCTIVVPRKRLRVPRGGWYGY